MTDRRSADGAIRRARPEEAPDLSDLAFRSKAHWGYDESFLAACREDLTVSEDDVLRGRVFVLDIGGHVVGFYRLRAEGDDAELSDLFVAPEAIGGGHGKRLWEHAVATARGLGCRAITLHSDPHAEGFYRAMGARRVGAAPSSVFPGRMLPLMRLDLP